MNNKQSGVHNTNYVPLEERFWKHVSKQGPLPSTESVRVWPGIEGTCCWEWTACINVNGYGVVGTSGNGKSDLAHRVAWFLATGAWPTPCACHKCDNPACVRFSHLFEGTNKLNSEDAIAKSRCSHLKGECNPSAKLTEVQVNHIKEELKHPYLGINKRLSSKYNVSNQTISAIRTGKVWNEEVAA